MTLAEAKPYLEHQQRQLLFRECVIGALSGGSKKDPVDEYCQACRTTGQADCENCDRKIEVVHG